MKLAVATAALAATLIPAAPALAHCGSVHHRAVYRAAWHAPVRHRAVHVARAGCGCATRVAYRRPVYRPAVYRAAYVPPRVVEVTYERPIYRPIYRPYRVGYAVPLYRPRPYFYHAGFERRYGHARFERPYGDRWARRGFDGGHRRWGGWR
jgi:hypothetical protein